MIILEAVDRKTGNAYNEKSFEQSHAEKILNKNQGWRIKEGQSLIHKDGAIVHKAVSQKKENKPKESPKEV